MEDVVVYLWVDVWEMSKYLAPAFWEREQGCPPLHVSLKNPTENMDEFIFEETMQGESRNFILLKRKIYLVPPCLMLRNGEIQYEGEKCELEWNPVENTVVAKNQYGAFSLVPAD